MQEKVLSQQWVEGGWTSLIPGRDEEAQFSCSELSNAHKRSYVQSCGVVTRASGTLLLSGIDFYVVM